MHNYTTRKAIETDCERTADIHKRSIIEGNSALYTPEQIAAWSERINPEKHKKMFLKETETTYVVETNNNIVGFGVIANDEIRAVYIDPAYFGKGAGKTLMHRLEEDTRSRGVTELHLDASFSAVPFYEKMGFTKIEPSYTTIGADVSIPGWLMRKKLV